MYAFENSRLGVSMEGTISSSDVEATLLSASYPSFIIGNSGCCCST